MSRRLLDMNQIQEQIREANRRGELTPGQRVRLQFLVEAEQLGAGVEFLIGILGTSFFGCVIGGFWAQRGTFNGVSEFSVFVAICFFCVWHGQRRLRQLAREKVGLVKGIVVHADGRVVWSGRHYRLELPSGPRASGALALRPGAYRFYFVPDSTTLLFADPLSEPVRARELLIGALMQARGFDEADLRDNRFHRLSDRQKRRLAADARWGLLVKSMASIIAGVAFVLAVVGFQIARGADYQVTAFLAAAPWAIIQSLIIADYIQMRRDLGQTRLAIVQGLGWPSGSYRRRWNIESLSFGVSPWTSEALVPGVRYRAFYLPRSRILLSLEPLLRG